VFYIFTFFSKFSFYFVLHMYRDVSERLSSLFALKNSFIVFSGASRYVNLEYSGNDTV